MGLTEHDLRALNQDNCISVLGAFIYALQKGDNKKHLLNVCAQTQTNYLSSAHRFIETLQGQHVDILDPHSTGKNKRYHPCLGQQIADCRSWTQPKQKKEPYTMDMFVALVAAFQAHSDPIRCFLGKDYAVYDWARLGIFTGFRVTEYAQSKLPKGQKFLLVPTNSFVPAEYHGTPLAFTLPDFRFYDKNHHLVPHALVQKRHLQHDILELEIRWRYDKSAHNFVIRRFRVTGHAIFDPVDAAVSIIHRRNLLQVPTPFPLGVWSSNGSSYRFLKDTEIKTVMQLAVDLAYPDPAHYMRIHKHLVLPHSNRVTAAVCLQKGGASNDEIAFKLRWHPTSVPTYLRDCFQAVGDLLQRSVSGVLQMSFS